MIISNFGERKPNLGRVLITGGPVSGKTSLTARFAKRLDRVLFINTDGNSEAQGYRSITLTRPKNWNDMLPLFKNAVDTAWKYRQEFDVTAFDLIESYDEWGQSLLADELNNMKKMLKAWGKINAFYKYASAHLDWRFPQNDQAMRIIFVSRDEEEYAKKDDPKNNIAKGDVIGYVPALRRKMKNLLLKDQAAEIRIEMKNGKRNYIIENIRFEECREELNRIINSPFVAPKAQAPAQENPQPKAETISGAQRRVLFDDAKNDADLLKTVCAKYGYESSAAILLSDYDNIRQDLLHATDGGQGNG